MQLAVYLIWKSFSGGLYGSPFFHSPECRASAMDTDQLVRSCLGSFRFSTHFNHLQMWVTTYAPQLAGMMCYFSRDETWPCSSF